MLDDISPVKSLIENSKQEIQHIFYNEALRESLLDTHYLPPTPPPEVHTPAPSLGDLTRASTDLSRIQTSMDEHKMPILDEADIVEIADKGGIPVHSTQTSCTDTKDDDDDDDQHAEDEALVLYPDSEKSPPFNHQQLHHMTSPNYKLLPWAQRCLTQLQDPIKKCEELYEILLALQDILDQNLNRKQQPYLDESPKVMKQRWDKIIEELYDKEKQQFDWYVVWNCTLCTIVVGYRLDLPIIQYDLFGRLPTGMWSGIVGYLFL